MLEYDMSVGGKLPKEADLVRDSDPELAMKGSKALPRLFAGL